jgi:hypothetical protein
MLLFLICFGLLACSNNRIEQVNNSDNSQFFPPFVYDSTTYHKIVNIEDTIHEELLTPEKREELSAFCDLFISAIQSDNIEEIKKVIDFPIWVECFKESEEDGFSFGDTITIDNFFQYKNLIFDDQFFEVMRKEVLDKEIEIYLIENFFTVVTLYKSEEAKNYEGFEIGDEARIYRFEYRKNNYTLVIVFCAG